MVTGEMVKVMEGFHHRAVQRIMGLTEKCGAGGEWEYPSVVESTEDTSLHPIGVYIWIGQANIEESMACRPVYELCT